LNTDSFSYHLFDSGRESLAVRCGLGVIDFYIRDKSKSGRFFCDFVDLSVFQIGNVTNQEQLSSF